jgi:surface protein
MKIEKMDYMFYKCKSLTKINLKNLNTEGASINNIFFGVNKECKVEVENKKIEDEFNKIKNK